MKLRIVGGVALAALAGLYLFNASWLAKPEGKLTILAHRGMAQQYPHEGVDDETCTASRIVRPTHDYLENTIRSMRRAFELGADIVEIDVHPTTDGQFVVFHDWTLDCRTNGRGVTREHSLAEIQALDIGYGYTADGGRTFPFRGKGERAPSLDEVLAAFPTQRFMINVKSNDPAEGDLLAAYLARRSPQGLDRFVVFGGWKPVARLKATLPQLGAYSKQSYKDCVAGYMAWGWAGRVPEACRNILVVVPQDQAWLAWGWPNRFLQRMRAAGSEVFVAGDMQLKPRQSLHGLDDPERLKRLPKDWKGGVSTDRIDLIGPALKASPRV